MTIKKPCEIEGLIESAIQALEQPMRLKHIKCKVEFESRNLRKLLCEWELYELILFQLIINAVQNSHFGSNVTVRIQVSRDKGQFLMHTSVIDCGIGFTAGKLKKVEAALKK